MRAAGHGALPGGPREAAAPLPETLPERSVRLAPDVTFSTHALAERPPYCARPLRDGELRLWLLRPEWQLLSKEDALARLSRYERKRAKCFPQPAIGKRFAVGRAVLRGILGGIVGARPDALELVDHESGRITLAGPHAAGALDVAVAYAGIWILIGVSAQPIGLATAFSVGDVVDHDEQQRVRLASVAGAARGAVHAEAGPAPDSRVHAHRVHTHDAGIWRVIDLPMPGRQCVAAVAAREIREVRASGWSSAVKLPLPAEDASRERRAASPAAGIRRTAPRG
ncbi:hypothetical protein [Burkholderia glumae]|uniref:Uncharacterized protein n=3 Tax=Burkholderia glumae TaxID=337 RepID=A0ABY5BE00_BURGL|nr:hypothetical protein [Burkholderia glumae]ACR31375.1 Hypothetical protein bglu_2g09710 [Burkholderia glumae BGR1]AJY64456.1 hypothetical protein KS03_4948 [Burkholderia glumae LMG 2196 = ATCC 33617]MCM2485467.1 hypothetical protein [Burkholderia glumae]MCM2511161.1 hypothetical protein [Burkholderia glumae]MCM2541039.1 hypothetical protein [Burkholderia glumae]